MKTGSDREFYWGVSSAAAQTEGAAYIDGRSASIWDSFSQKRGKIYGGHKPEPACDFYHRYAEDIRIVKQLNIPHFRTSISWSRVKPEGRGALNQKGMDFYKRLANTCLEQGITPWFTLYHWDLPQVLEESGGWTNRDIVSWFEDYVYEVSHELKGLVKHWMVLNEPLVFTGAGYFLGVHAPGRKGMRNFLPAVHHATLAQSAGARVLKAVNKRFKVGTTYSCSPVEPYRPLKKDHQACIRADALLNRLFIEPTLGLGYPKDDLPVLDRLEKYMHTSDEEDMIFDFDFIGIQNYTREIIRNHWLTPYIRARLVEAEKRKVETNVMGWEVYPGSVRSMVEKFHSYPIKELIITENGYPTESSEVKDVERMQYLMKVISDIQQYKSEFPKLSGYFIWTLTDNFEWAEGYKPRFGIIGMDFETQKRTIRASAKAYSRLISEDVWT